MTRFYATTAKTKHWLLNGNVKIEGFDSAAEMTAFLEAHARKILGNKKARFSAEIHAPHWFTNGYWRRYILPKGRSRKGPVPAPFVNWKQLVVEEMKEESLGYKSPGIFYNPGGGKGSKRYPLYKVTPAVPIYVIRYIEETREGTTVNWAEVHKTDKKEAE